MRGVLGGFGGFWGGLEGIWRCQSGKHRRALSPGLRGCIGFISLALSGNLDLFPILHETHEPRKCWQLQVPSQHDDIHMMPVSVA